ncbi:glycine oxidase ThiO [Salininema proteolyticum]|uniref:glycine oxidase n=1 Tax=Salininema proteolyticum TaxID=1607685 RepID=A0ABV8TSU1_9ACTN
MRLTVAGAGIIGLATAWRASQKGWGVTVRDPRPGSGATHAAAGMLAAVTEAEFGEEDLVPFAVESVRLWRGFAEELQAESGVGLDYSPEGTILLGWNESDRAAVRRQVGLYRRLALPVEEVGARGLRKQEPLIGHRCREGFVIGSDHSVDPRAVLTALDTACRKRGVVFEESAYHRGEGTGPIVIAAGNGSRELGLPVRPVRGVVLRLRAGEGALTRTIRAIVDGDPLYIVPRPGGEVVVGATSDEIADEERATAGAVLDLLRKAADLVPEIREYHLGETTVGFRPTTPDNLPLIGRVDDRTWAATGHYRHGIALAPATARAVVEMVGTGSSGLVPPSFDPLRATAV